MKTCLFIFLVMNCNFETIVFQWEVQCEVLQRGCCHFGKTIHYITFNTLQICNVLKIVQMNDKICHVWALKVVSGVSGKMVCSNTLTKILFYPSKVKNSHFIYWHKSTEEKTFLSVSEFWENKIQNTPPFFSVALILSCINQYITPVGKKVHEKIQSWGCFSVT